jgi:hypothetical protein
VSPDDRVRLLATRPPEEVEQRDWHIERVFQAEVMLDELRAVQ